MSAEFLIAGLGNPGERYIGSPHNAGFEVVERARALCRGPRFAVKGEAALSRCRWRGRDFLLLKPLTFMNLSGKAVALWLRKESLPLDRLVVCYDDLDLPLGQVRLRHSGGAGGHHGMESLLSELGCADFPRMRLGIQDPRVEKPEQVDYLLSPLSGEARATLEGAADVAAEAVLDCVARGFTAAMNRYNRRSAAAESPGPDPEKT